MDHSVVSVSSMYGGSSDGGVNVVLIVSAALLPRSLRIPGWTIRLIRLPRNSNEFIVEDGATPLGECAVSNLRWLKTAFLNSSSSLISSRIITIAHTISTEKLSRYGKLFDGLAALLDLLTTAPLNGCYFEFLFLLISAVHRVLLSIINRAADTTTSKSWCTQYVVLGDHFAELNRIHT